MSWNERIETNIEITTGDGKVYTPLYFISTKKVDFNVAEFNFPEIKGTLVKRRKAKGGRHTWQLTFQGENHLDIARDFETSADDERPWKVYHPMFDNLLVQPTNITIDPTGLNTTVITVEVVETITDDAPVIDIDPGDKSRNDATNLRLTTAESFADNVQPTPADINQMQDDINSVYETGAAGVPSGDQANDYFNQFNEALSNALDAAEDTLSAASSMVDLMYFPATFVFELRGRLNILQTQFIELGEEIIDYVTPNSKTIYETNAGSIIGAMVEAAVNPEDDDYLSKNDVLEVAEIVMNIYNQYIENLDSLQTENGGAPESYVPNYEIQQNLNALVNFAISQLFNIATTAKTERTHILEADSNLIILAHRFYGLEIDDSTLNNFITTNNIGRNEYLQIKKGRELVYLV